MERRAYPSDVSDDEWAFVAPYLTLMTEDAPQREYSLREIAIITRAGPARQLGLAAKGHLGPGADADVTVYSRSSDYAEMFATPRYVVKGGVLVMEEGQLRRAPAGRRLHVRPSYDDAVLRDLGRWFERYGTIALENYPVAGVPDAPQPLAGARSAGGRA